MEEIISKLATFITQKILRQPKRTLGPNELIISSGLIDSFNLVDLGLFIEETFNIRIEDTELNANTFDTLEQLAKLIQSRQ